jgi:hypothetical protein
MDGKLFKTTYQQRKSIQKNMKINKKKKKYKNNNAKMNKGQKEDANRLNLFGTKRAYATITAPFILLFKFIENEIIFFLLCISAPFIIAAQHNNNIEILMSSPILVIKMMLYLWDVLILLPVLHCSFYRIL